MKDQITNIIATVIFFLAVLHTFSANKFKRMSIGTQSGSVAANILHILGEVEIVFGLWAAILCLFLYFQEGALETLRYLDGLNFTEPAFVFVIMVVASSRPVIDTAQGLILLLSKLIPCQRELSIYLCCLIVGPLFGSVITEPAAMTVTALVLRDKYFTTIHEQRFKYLTLAVLFVNVSIGGVLTPFAAPPVLMVAGKWNWGLHTMLTLFGWKAVIAVALNSLLATFVLRKELILSRSRAKVMEQQKVSPFALKVVHLLFLLFIVINVHHGVVFIGALLLFLGIVKVTVHHQEDLKIRESLLVACFLGGLVVLGGLQGWWLRPLLQNLSEFPLFLGSTFLTAFIDNAALTYLGSQVPNIPNELKYALVGGAVCGGGLTVIANAPNPAGYSILEESFGQIGIQPLKLLFAGLVPTLIAMACFWLM